MAYFEDFVLGHGCHTFYSELPRPPKIKKKKRNVSHSVVARFPSPGDLPEPRFVQCRHDRLSHQVSPKISKPAFNLLPLYICISITNAEFVFLISSCKRNSKFIFWN